MKYCTRICTAIQICVPQRARKKTKREKWVTLVEFPEDFGEMAEDLGKWIWQHKREKRWISWRVVKLADEYVFSAEHRVDVLDAKYPEEEKTT